MILMASGQYSVRYFFLRLLHFGHGSDIGGVKGDIGHNCDSSTYSCGSTTTQWCAPPIHGNKLRVHDLRHSCATLLFTMGVQPATVQRILRHSSITVTTGTYVEVIAAVQRDALESMGTLFAQNDDGSKSQQSSKLSSNAPGVDHDERVLPGEAKGNRTPANSCRNTL
jgi:hypothetical protein